MRKKNFKGRCEKKHVSKCKDLFRSYDVVQSSYVDVINERNDIVEIKCNVPLDDMEYTTDFLCIKKSGQIMVRECVYRSKIAKPMTIKLLDASRQYWTRHGVEDWGIVINEQK